MATKMNSPIWVHINEIARKLQDKRVAIMVGAGFSKNVKVSPGQTIFPTWHELGNIIFKEVRNKEPGKNDIYLSAARLAEEYEAVYGRVALDQLIKDSIPDAQCEHSKLHERLLELPWADIFTTNYDTFLERATIKANSRKYDLVTTKEDLVFSRSPRIVKLHGSFPSQRPFIITEKDYRKYPHDFSFFVNTVQQSLIENLFCLIGFSGDDPNFLHWIGWIQDNFGKDFSPKIYLIDILDDMSEAQRMLLERRNIVPINLSLIREEDGVVQEKSAAYADAYDKFFNYLEKAIKSDILRWGNGSSRSPKNKTHDETKLQEIIQDWKDEREQYPGWVILPHRQRNILWGRTRNWLRELDKTDFGKVSESLRLNFVYELCWRFDQFLYPLFGQEIITQCENIAKVAVSKKEEFNKWFEVILTLMKCYRMEGHHDKWNRLKTAIQEHKKNLSDEQLAKLYYEQSLFALFSFDIPLLKKELQEWPEMKTLPFMEAKKASLFAEIGELSLARKILDNALDAIRRLINTSLGHVNLTLFSQEGCIISILQNVASADNWRQGKWSVQRAEEKYEGRMKELRQFYCAPGDELLLFSARLSGPPTPVKSEIETVNHFDIGKTTQTHHSGSWDEEALLGYAFLNFSEKTGIPFRLPSLNFDVKSAIGAIKRISPYSFHWSLVTLLRLGDKANVDLLINRETLLSMSIDDIDYYISQLIDALKNARESIEQVTERQFENLGVSFAKVIPEILSRLCTRCSFESLEKIIDLLLYLYDLDRKEHYVSVATLVERLAGVWPKEKNQILYDRLMKFPSVITENLPIREEFPNPFHYLLSDDNIRSMATQTDVIADATIIRQDMEKLISENLEDRTWAIVKLGALHLSGMLDDMQKKIFGEKLWDNVDPKTGFPLQSHEGFFKVDFIDLPHPSKINPRRLFEKYIFEWQDDLFPIIGSTSMSLTFGDSKICNEIMRAYNVLSQNKVSLSEKKASNILEKIVTCWNQYKERISLEQQRVPSLFAFGKDELKRRSYTLIGLLTKVVIPNLSAKTSKNVKNNAENLLNEMESQGLICNAARIASIGIFPEKRESIWNEMRRKFYSHDPSVSGNAFLGIAILLLMKKDANFDLDVAQILFPLTNCIKDRSFSSLYSAFDIFEYILTELPEALNEEYINDALLGLELIQSESDPLDTHSHISGHDRLKYRQAAMRLASAFYKYYKMKNIEMPSVISEWKEKATSENEFWEIKNEWREE